MQKDPWTNNQFLQQMEVGAAALGLGLDAVQGKENMEGSGHGLQQSQQASSPCLVPPIPQTMTRIRGVTSNHANRCRMEMQPQALACMRCKGRKLRTVQDKGFQTCNRQDLPPFQQLYNSSCMCKIYDLTNIPGSSLMLGRQLQVLAYIRCKARKVSRKSSVKESKLTIRQDFHFVTSFYFRFRQLRQSTNPWRIVSLILDVLPNPFITAVFFTITLRHLHIMQVAAVGAEDLGKLDEGYKLMESAYHKIISSRNGGFRNTLLSARFVDSVRRLQGEPCSETSALNTTHKSVINDGE